MEAAEKNLPVKKRKRIEILFFAGIFACLLILYIRVVPLVIFNMDDWEFLSFGSAGIVPDWNAWNPSRILPRQLMPLVAQLSAYLVYPFTHDFLGAIELGMAITVSMMITVYSYAFYQMIRKRRGLSVNLSFGLTMLFLLLHFLVFRTKNESNDYLLNGYYDATTFFFYLIPALLNASLVLCFCPVGFFSGKLSVQKRALLIPAVYFAVFSNIHQSIILAIYVCFDMLNQLIGSIREKGRKKVRTVWKHMAFLVLWVISLMFENSGGRAASVRYKDGSDLLVRGKQCLRLLWERVSDTNVVFIILVGILIIAAILLCISIFRKSGNKKVLWFFRQWNGMEMFCSALIALTYVFLVCSASLQGYIKRGDVLLSSLFFLFMFMIEIIAILLNRIRLSRIILPAILVVCLIQIPTSGKTLKSSINRNIPYQTAKAISQDIVNAYVEADRNHENDISIQVPQFPENNWPLSNHGSMISKVLFKYGIITRIIKADLVPSPEKNKEYNLPKYREKQKTGQ